MSDFSGREVISINEACEAVGVSRRTMYNWIKQGKVKYIRIASGSVRIFVDTLWRSPDSKTTKKKKNEPKIHLA